LILPWITFTGQNPVRAPAGKNNYVLALSPVPIDTSEIFGLPFIESLEKAAAIPGRIAFIIWESDGKGEDQYAKVSELRALTDFFHTPFLCFGEGLSGETLSAAVDAHLQNEKKRAILFIGLDDVLFSSLTDYPAVHISSASELADAVAVESPGLIAMGAIDIEAIKAIRRHPVTAMIPVIVLPELIANPEEVNELCRFPQVVLCNRNVAASPEFIQRIRAIAADDSILPMYTGALVKKVILYFNQHAKNHISRWKLADSVNVSEDYLTRIFRKEMGCSLWEYLNLYRVSLAVDLLTHTGETIYEIAMHTGFQDQAYFCRVFKKIYGKAPGQLRNTQKVGKIQ
jgi:AraC-like DNA-binding protein